MTVKILDHINHIAAVAGFEHVGIGSDFDGVTGYIELYFTLIVKLFYIPFFSVPVGLNDVSYYPDLFTLLAEDPKWTEENLRKLAGENFIRVFTEAERVSLI